MAEMTPVLLYILPTPNHGPQHMQFARRFFLTYLNHRPTIDHALYVVSNGGSPSAEAMALFSQINTFAGFIEHDDSGLDCGGHIAASKSPQIDGAEMIVCFGGPSYFQRSGWLERMVEVWQRHGPGMYGSFASYESLPHLNTCGYWLAPWMLASYPLPVVTRAQRYQFEHGYNALWLMVHQLGYPVLHVTWDGEYEWHNWRKPANIYRKGNQSNCITFFQHNDFFASADPIMRAALTRSTDTITDPHFVIRGNSGLILRKRALGPRIWRLETEMAA
jgi:hypothetical protein